MAAPRMIKRNIGQNTGPDWERDRVELRARLETIWGRRPIPPADVVKGCLRQTEDLGEKVDKTCPIFAGKRFTEIVLGESLRGEAWLWRFPDELAAYFLGTKLLAATRDSSPQLLRVDPDWFEVEWLFRQRRRDIPF